MICLQEFSFDFYTIFVDANKIGEDLLFCRSVTAGAKIQDLFQIHMKRVCATTT